MKINFLLIFILILSSPIALGADCDYFEYEFYNEIVEVIHDVDSNEVIGHALIIDGFKQDLDKYPSFRITNTLDSPITIEINYTQIVRGKPLHKLSKIITIPTNDFARLRGAYGYDSYYNTHIDLESISYLFIEPKAVLSKDKIRLNKSICMNCNSNEIFCKKKKECITKNAVPLNVKPECGLYQECVSQYINLDSGLCEKSPAQIQEEEKKEIKFIIYSIIGLASLIFIGGIVIPILKNKTEKERQKTIQKEKELETKKMDNHRIKNKYKKTSIKESYKKMWFERFGNKIYLDKKDYFRFKSNDALLHRWRYKSFYGSFNTINQIHHIDADQYNNKIWNLIELDPNDHKKIKHGRITCDDWDSGINELKRIGILETKFPEHVIKHLKNK
ncbi:MAG: hypothetical protein KAQ92_09090 [Candidatus Aenigmarchaeota archaeon]|nr:hypothetical protein [Candidatus Aenigmarchaeota archaeon]